MSDIKISYNDTLNYIVTVFPNFAERSEVMGKISSIVALCCWGFAALFLGMMYASNPNLVLWSGCSTTQIAFFAAPFAVAMVAILASSVFFAISGKIKQ